MTDGWQHWLDWQRPSRRTTPPRSPRSRLTTAARSATFGRRPARRPGPDEPIVSVPVAYTERPLYRPEG